MATQQWEYRFWSLVYSMSDDERKKRREELAELGREGWEAVGITTLIYPTYRGGNTTPQSDGSEVLLKRPIT